MKDVPRVLVLAPAGRNARVAETILAASDIAVDVCTSLEEVIGRLATAHCLVATEEALLNDNRAGLAAWIRNQPPWSEFPVVLLTMRGAERDPRLAFLDEHVIALERPFQPRTLVNSVHAALRARRRQLEVKQHIDETLALNQRQKLLIRELHHRVKNMLANVQAMMRATAHRSSDLETFTRDFSARIVSLAETHGMLTDDYWQTASLSEMLARQLGHYELAEGQRVRIEGPDVQLVADIAVPFGMAIHELASNSSRYGALSRPEGRLCVSWAIEPAAGGGDLLDLVWQEGGGPPVEPPTRRGFGTTLLERVLTVQCDAKIDLAYRPEGFHCALRMPLRESRLVPQY